MIFIVVVVAVIGLIGLRIFNLKDNSRAEGQSAAQQPKKPAKSASPTIPVPPGWNIYADAEVGVQFVYPGAYGSFKTKTDYCCNLSLASFPQYESMQTSSTPVSDYLPGVSGAFALNSYKKGVMETDSIKYAPKIKLDGNDWVVLEPGTYNPHNYQPGDVYPEISRSNTTGIDVYTAKSTVDGVTNYTLFFVSGGRLRELQLPTFNDGTHSANNAINDEAPYDALMAQIRDSINLY